MIRISIWTETSCIIYLNYRLNYDHLCVEYFNTIVLVLIYINIYMTPVVKMNKCIAGVSLMFAFFDSFGSKVSFTSLSETNDNNNNNSCLSQYTVHLSTGFLTNQQKTKKCAKSGRSVSRIASHRGNSAPVVLDVVQSMGSRGTDLPHEPLTVRG